MTRLKWEVIHKVGEEVYLQTRRDRNITIWDYKKGNGTHVVESGDSGVGMDWGK